MAYLGNAPTSVPLSSADILDSAITTAKIANGAVAIVDLSATGTPSSSTFLRGDNVWGAAGGKFESALLHVRDEKASGTSGGGVTSGSWVTRTLNTSVTNEISGASLASSQITLPSGTYYIHASAPANRVNQHKAKLRNVTDSSDTFIGTSEYCESGYPNTTHSFVIGRFTIASSKTFELQHRVAASETTYNIGLGVAASFSVVEIYTDVRIWKVA
jgi:hypothetical protein